MAPFIIFILVLSQAFIASFGTEGPSRHLDGRYFHAAAVCLGDELSPYNLASFATCWEQATGTPWRAPFVFPPPALLLSLPMIPLDQAGAMLWQDVAGAACLLLLAATLWRIAGVGARRGWPRLAAAAWIALGLSVSGIPAALMIGQISLFPALGIALLCLYILRDRRHWLFPGSLLVLMKPHLGLLLLAFAWAGWPLRDLKWKLPAAAGFGLMAAAYLAVDPDFPASWAASLRLHAESPFAKISGDTLLHGAIGMAGFGPAGLAAMAACLGCGLAAGAGLPWPVLPPEDDAGQAPLLIFLILFGAFLFPHKTYDLGYCAPAFALVALLPRNRQALALPPCLLLWRPGLARWAGEEMPVMMADGATLALMGLCLGTAFRSRNARQVPRSPPPALRPAL